MFLTNGTIVKRSVIIVAALIISIGCWLAYMHHDSYPPNISEANVARPALSNPEILRNWLPPVSFTYTMNRLDDYLSTNNIRPTSMSAKDNVNGSTGTYDFKITVMPSGEVLSTSVTISNLDGIISTAVIINGNLQTASVAPTVQSSNNSGANITFNGIDTLVSDGVTASQINVFQQEFQKFMPSATVVTIDTTRVASTLDSNTGNIVYEFPVSVDGTNYTTTLDCIGSTQAELKILDSTAKHVDFDSGIVTGAS